MKLAVGYPVTDEEDVVEAFVAAVEKHVDRVDEIYFALPGDPSGRSPTRNGKLQAEALGHLHAQGVKLDLLFNANCYGAAAASPELAEHVCRQVAGAGDVEIVTTTSPFIAETLRREFPELKLRASVNMRIGTVAGMRILSDLFDGFSVQREYNRDLQRLARLRDWCTRNGKQLCGLLNSGCLAFCPGQTFHDNLVAHEAEQGTRLPTSLLACRRHLKNPKHWTSILAATWVRPEDVHRYEGIFDLAKLATRMHWAPERVIRAYARGHWSGNLLDLLEPGYADVASGLRLNNRAFPKDWFDRTTSCGRDCEGCAYCSSVLAKAGGHSPVRSPPSPNSHITVFGHDGGNSNFSDANSRS